jgi:ribonuclease E
MADFGIGEALAAIGAAASSAASSAVGAISSAASAIGIGGATAAGADAGAGAAAIAGSDAFVGGATGTSAAALAGGSGGSGLATLAAGASLVGTGITALGSATKGSQQQTASNVNAAIEQQAATTDLNQAQAQASNDRTKTGQLLGEIIADYGASGVDPTGVGGSPLAVLSSNAAQGALQSQTDIYQGIVRANAAQGQAALDTVSGEEAYEAGMTSAAGTVLSGVGSTATKLAQANYFSSSSSSSNSSTQY